MVGNVALLFAGVLVASLKFTWGEWILKKAIVCCSSLAVAVCVDVLVASIFEDSAASASSASNISFAWDSAVILLIASRAFLSFALSDLTKAFLQCCLCACLFRNSLLYTGNFGVIFQFALGKIALHIFNMCQFMLHCLNHCMLLVVPQEQFSGTVYF